MSFSANIQIQKTYPAVIYEPDTSEETDGVWHEDHEIDGAMYRAANATFDESHETWSLKVSSQPAYATVQDTDGSTHYYSMPKHSGSWMTWEGSDNNAVYNAVDFGLIANDSSTSTAEANTTALNNLIGVAFLAGGGTIVIPRGQYYLYGPVEYDYLDVAGNDHGLIIAGTSGDTEFTQQDITADTFSFTGLSSGRGFAFEISGSRTLRQPRLLRRSRQPFARQTHKA